ncbi:MAG: hypothetical protein EOP87_13030, partial [Verrucomicrobiaceae bacterium]
MISRFLNDTFMGTVSRSLLAVFLFGTVACDRTSTPEWGERSPDQSPSASTAAVAPDPPPAPASTGKSNPARRQDVRFIAYNVKNWLVTNRYENGRTLESKPKPAEEKAAVISILARHTPDVVGLCEIGTAADLAEIQQQLKEAGIDLPHSHFTGGADPVRHLGFLSRFPISATGRPEKTEYHLQNKLYFWNRGVLDVTVDVHGRHFRFLGCHLKSKREVEEGDDN